MGLNPAEILGFSAQKLNLLPFPLSEGNHLKRKGNMAVLHTVASGICRKSTRLSNFSKKRRKSKGLRPTQPLLNLLRLSLGLGFLRFFPTQPRTQPPNWHFRTWRLRLGKPTPINQPTLERTTRGEEG